MQVFLLVAVLKLQSKHIIVATGTGMYVLGTGGQIVLSALGGGVAGAISSISIGGPAVVSWLGTILLGGFGSVAGGLISGSVTDWESAAWAFGIGAVANVAARGITTLINKGITASAQKVLNSPILII